MIDKITTNEYLKRFDSMTLCERQSYLQQVKEWNGKHAPVLLRRQNDTNTNWQSFMQCGITWNAAEQEAFRRGVLLLTPFSNKADSWLPDMIYTKSVSRVIKRMVRLLSALDKQDAEIHQSGQNAENVQNEKSVQDVQGEVNAQGAQNVTEKHVKAPDTEIVRPKHIDQYVHLLPKKTQERAALVKPLLSQMDVARENARLLMNDDKSNATDRARWASLATKCDKEIRSIYKELDSEWEKLVQSNMVITDDLGNVRVVPSPTPSVETPEPETKEPETPEPETPESEAPESEAAESETKEPEASESEAAEPKQQSPKQQSQKPQSHLRVTNVACLENG